CDAFHLVPPGSDPGFTDALVEICGLERVDAVLPQSSFELLPLAEDKQRFGETAVLVAGPEAVRRSNDKAETYALLDAIGVRGPERTIDGIAGGGRILLGHPKTREEMRAGLAMYFQTLDDSGLMDVAAKIAGELELGHFFNIQLVGDAVIEINPRISTVVYQDDLNLPYLGLKHALGELGDDELAAYAARVRPTRKALRYFDQVEW